MKIKDNGTGMDEETLKKAFDPYFTTKAKGTGLGLSNVRRMVEEMKGKIELVSEFGEGTTAIIKFPIIENNIKGKSNKSAS